MSDYISSELSPSDKDSWSTPLWLYSALNHEFQFRVDACASESNAKCGVFISEDMNALDMENWASASPIYSHLKNQFVWINPPYSRGMIKAFIEKAYEQCAKNKINSVLLVPATPDASWWPTNATEIRFITGGRISFINPISKKSVNGNTKGSALIIFKHSDIGSPMVTRYVQRNNLKSLGEMMEVSK